MKDVTIVVGAIGQSIMRSEDGGASWTKLKRELSEIAAVCWLPN